MLSRRQVLLGGAGVVAVAAGSAGALSIFGRADAASGAFPIEMTREEWKAKLSPRQFAVLRDADTERAFTSPLNDEHRAGTFHCAGCDNALYSSEAKFDSGTGWPSFYKPIEEGAVKNSTDYKLVYPRTEEHCADCGGHLGHVFDDGPPPTGKRHCINGVALVFRPQGGGEPVLG
ncbi:peptide-methionine (R)-S-oxide reductase MsrB [Afifella sp. IM 167]|uniref:peptide-methionine (R)-S-oxide reductase MsrB n=1 Tax=Afifella sp. IM 167 TaxID=2033586 RepID=UPI001CCF6F68|nr:peptide-methionine (R)-S-oxide reductase MsrB [Afifella sp. IM 167]MBZ8135027.1 peptide-methionine (R)-S-oxide reductase [Afifella sp. IM 167]